MIFLILALSAGACASLSGPDCIDETRSLSVTARLSSVEASAVRGDSGTAQVFLFEARNYKTKRLSARDIMWFAGSGLDRSAVSGIHIHEKGTDRLLFDIPLEPIGPTRYVITWLSARRPYTGATGWNELYEILGNERAYVDVHTLTHPNGQLRGEFTLDFPNWQSFEHAYCS